VRERGIRRESEKGGREKRLGKREREGEGEGEGEDDHYGSHARDLNLSGSGPRSVI